MAIYKPNPDMGYTCGGSEAGSEMVSIFIDAAVNEEDDSTFEAKFADGGMTIYTTKAFAKEIASAFTSVSEEA